jgi:hypothetical protein
MNMRRGLLRAWIVVSAIWMLLVCINGWGQLSEMFVAIEPPADRGAVTLPPGPYACWATRNADNMFVIRSPEYPTLADETMSLAEAWRRCIAYKLQIPAEALVPPIILLALGLVLSWVVRGFKTT